MKHPPHPPKNISPSQATVRKWRRDWGVPSCGAGEGGTGRAPRGCPRQPHLCPTCTHPCRKRGCNLHWVLSDPRGFCRFGSREDAAEPCRSQRARVCVVKVVFFKKKNYLEVNKPSRLEAKTGLKYYWIWTRAKILCHWGFPSQHELRAAWGVPGGTVGRTPPSRHRRRNEGLGGASLAHFVLLWIVGNTGLVL